MLNKFDFTQNSLYKAFVWEKLPRILRLNKVHFIMNRVNNGHFGENGHFEFFRATFS